MQRGKKWLKIYRYFLQRKCRPKNQVLVIYHLRRYWQGITPSESVKVKHSHFASENLTITRKRCKIGGKLVLITNRRSYISFRLVLKSVTLNDPERRNGRYIALFQRFWQTYVPTIASSSIELIDHQVSTFTQ